MDLGPHTAFIVGSYAATALIVAALLGWILIDKLGLQAQLRRLEQQAAAKAGEASSTGFDHATTAQRTDTRSRGHDV